MKSQRDGSEKIYAGQKSVIFRIHKKYKNEASIWCPVVLSVATVNAFHFQSQSSMQCGITEVRVVTTAPMVNKLMHPSTSVRSCAREKYLDGVVTELLHQQKRAF